MIKFAISEYTTLLGIGNTFEWTKASVLFLWNPIFHKLDNNKINKDYCFLLATAAY